MLFGFIYLTARRLIRDDRLAALATYSFTAIYVFGYYSHHDLTHTTALSAFLAASWYVVRSSLRDAEHALVPRAGPVFRSRDAGQVELHHVRARPPARLSGLARLSRPGVELEDRAGRIGHRGRRRCPRSSGRCTWDPPPATMSASLLGREDGRFLRVLVAGTLELATGVLVYPQALPDDLPDRFRRVRPGTVCGHAARSPAGARSRQHGSSARPSSLRSLCTGCWCRLPARRISMNACCSRPC